MNKFSPRTKAPITGAPRCEYEGMDGLCVPPPPALGDQPCRNPVTGVPEFCFRSPYADTPCAPGSPYLTSYVCQFRAPPPPPEPPVTCIEMLGFWLAILAALVCA